MSHNGSLLLHDFIRKLPGVFATAVGPGKIRVNDMSLPFGGAFEIDGNSKSSAAHESTNLRFISGCRPPRSMKW